MTSAPRLVGVDDVAVVRAARLAALADAPLDLVGAGDEATWSDDAWAVWIAGHLALAVATHDDEPVAIGGLEPDADGRERAWLAGLWVAPARRGTGLADALLTTLLDAAEAPRIELDVVASNERAVAFYTRHLFAAVGHAPRPTDGVVETRMARDLR